MTRQEFRVLSAYGYALGPDIVPSTDGLPGWNLVCELHDGPRAALTDVSGNPVRFRTIGDAAHAAEAFGHPTAMISFGSRPEHATVGS